MKRYIVFAGYNYYPSCGFDAFRGSYNTLEEAKEAVEILENKLDWTQIIDQEQYP